MCLVAEYGSCLIWQVGDRLIWQASDRLPWQVSVSYLSEEQLYAPWAERAAMLRSAHHFEPQQPPARAAAEAAVAARSAATASDESRLRRVTEAALQEAATAMGTAVGAALGVSMGIPAGGTASDAGGQRACLQRLRALLHELEPLLEASHWLVQV